MDQAQAEQKIIELKKHFVQELESAITHLADEFSRLQVGRAHSGLVESINVEAYGSVQPLKNIASVNIPDPKQILISPWDKSVLNHIEKAIRTSDLGLNPINDGAGIRLVLPELTEERRRDLGKIVHKLAEESKIRIRQARHDIHNKIKQMEKDKLISEDKLRWEEDELKKSIDEYNKKIDEASKKKEEAIMTV